MRAYTLRVRARTKEIEMARKKSNQNPKLTEKRIGFWKYSGTRWRELPTEYLKWVKRQKNRRRSDPVLPQMEQECRSVVG